ncbi:response regulator [Rhodocytophaga aerolata]|uniref:Response regulator n=1 Tax=Rhodocytophaga aerolata TaxID=455078 RepID=A0ABT8RGW1_9BACT|nr:response regulator [Rhodocytophaga aerolata]MDO1451338.1 response regulator [Rhodocytophaga aerolata]
MKKFSCILLVDDDKATNFANRLLLEDMDVTEKIMVALNGKEAIEIIGKACLTGSCPELILLDVNMPVMNGFEFLEAYSKLDIAQKQSVVILMLTTSLNPKDVDRLKQAPIQGFLNKPLTEQMVSELLQKYIKNSRQ